MAVTTPFGTDSGADDYHASLPFNESWADLEDGRKLALRRLATRVLNDVLTWASDVDPTTEDTVACASYEFALALDGEDTTADNVVANLDLTQAGDTKFGGGAAWKPIPDRVLAMIPSNLYTAGATSAGSPHSITLTRV